MHVLDEGRRPFLEFLRNLTPQVALLSVAFVISTRIDFAKFDLGNTAITLLFWALVVISILSMAANAINFMVDYCQTLNDLDASVKARLLDQKVTVWQLFNITVVESWNLKRRLAVELIFAVFSIYALMLAAIISSIFQGARLLGAHN